MKLLLNPFSKMKALNLGSLHTAGHELVECHAHGPVWNLEIVRRTCPGYDQDFWRTWSVTPQSQIQIAALDWCTKLNMQKLAYVGISLYGRTAYKKVTF